MQENLPELHSYRAAWIIKGQRFSTARQRFSTATAMCSQIAVAVAGLPTHAATDLFNLSQFTLINIITYLNIIVN